MLTNPSSTNYCSIKKENTNTGDIVYVNKGPLSNKSNTKTLYMSLDEGRLCEWSQEPTLCLEILWIARNKVETFKSSISTYYSKVESGYNEFKGRSPPCR